MPVGVEGFQKERLIQIRKARRLTAISLADMAGLRQPTISQYEKGKQNPRQENLDNMANVLNVPVGFFLRPIDVDKPSKVFYRSMSAATKAARESAEARYEWALEAIDYLLGFFDFPELNFPELEVPQDFRDIDEWHIEILAKQLREYWMLGNGPITNMIRTLESNGVVTWRTAFEARTLDAFSEYRLPHPVVVLSSDKQNYFRSRFDAAHELGHMVLHQTVDRAALKKSHEFNLIEVQAHHFAAAFLLPATAFEADMWSPSLDTFRALKPRWNVSIAMQIMRCKQLGLATESELERLWINRSRRGWSKREPLDDAMEVECPNLINKSFKMLIEENVRSGEQIASDLCLSTADLENLADLPAGYIDGQKGEADPMLKSSQQKIVPFRRD